MFDTSALPLNVQKGECGLRCWSLLAGLSHTGRKPYGRQRGRLSTLPLDGGAGTMCECGEVGAREYGLDEDGMWMAKWWRNENRR
jgi:hypothetical protein